MKVVSAESGKAFDPRVVEVLSRRYVDLERMAQEKTRTWPSSPPKSKSHAARLPRRASNRVQPSAD